MAKINLYKKHIEYFISSYKGGKSRKDVNTDKPIYKLSSNENMLGMSPMAKQAILNNIDSLYEYPSNDAKDLQVALSNYYKNELDSEQFITANSGTGVIKLIIDAFLGEGLECIISTPTFGAYKDFCYLSGVKVIDVPLIGDHFKLDIVGIVNSINANTRIIWLTSPNNPTGSYISKNELENLISQIPNHVVLVYDEVYFHFATAKDYTAVLPYVKAGKNIIGLNSLSKAYGLAGLRVGYAYANKKTANYVNKLRRPFLLDKLSIEATKAALNDKDFIEKTIKMVNSGKLYLYKELDKLGIKYWKSETNFITIRPPVKSLEFESRLQEQGILVRIANDGNYSFIRVTIGNKEANESFIVALKKILLEINQSS